MFENEALIRSKTNVHIQNSMMNIAQMLFEELISNYCNLMARNRTWF